MTNQTQTNSTLGVQSLVCQAGEYTSCKSFLTTINELDDCQIEALFVLTFTNFGSRCSILSNAMLTDTSETLSAIVFDATEETICPNESVSISQRHNMNVCSFSNRIVPLNLEYLDSGFGVVETTTSLEFIDTHPKIPFNPSMSPSPSIQSQTSSKTCGSTVTFAFKPNVCGIKSKSLYHKILKGKRKGKGSKGLQYKNYCEEFNTPKDIVNIVVFNEANNDQLLFSKSQMKSGSEFSISLKSGTTFNVLIFSTSYDLIQRVSIDICPLHTNVFKTSVGSIYLVSVEK